METHFAECQLTVENGMIIVNFGPFQVVFTVARTLQS